MGFLLACSEKEPDIFYQQLDFPTKKDPRHGPTPASEARISLPVRNDAEEFDILVNNYGAKIIYETHYFDDYDSYPYFLEALAEDKLRIPFKNIDTTEYPLKYYHLINKSDLIFKEYEKHGLGFILRKYFRDSGRFKKVYRYHLKPVEKRSDI